MDEPVAKRVKVIVEHPVNVLFKCWLTQWKCEAAAVQGHMKNTIAKALQSLKVYPLALQSGTETKILNGFGDFLCKRLDEELSSFKESHRDLSLQTVRRYIKVEKGAAASLYSKKKTLTALPKESPPQITSSQPPPIQYCSPPKTSYFKRVFSDITDAKPDANIATTSDEPLTMLKSYSEISTPTSTGEVTPSKSGSKNEFAEPSFATARQTSVLKSDAMTSLSVKPSSSSSISFPIHKSGSRRDSASGCLPASSLTNLKSVASETSFIIIPGNLSIQLVVDYSEKGGKSTVTNHLTKLGVNFREERLAAGDYLWVVRDLNNPANQLVLDVIVERKRIDDLAHSICDKTNRYVDQKVRLKESGMRTVVFLLEKHPSSKNIKMPLETLFQAITNTQIHDGFYVKITESGRDTAVYLASITKKLTELWSKRSLMSCPRENLPTLSPECDPVPLQTLNELQTVSGKTRPLSLQELFLRQLMVVRGITGEKAYAIVQSFGTLGALRKACLACVEPESLIGDVTFGSGNKKIGPLLSKQIAQFVMYA